MKFNEMTLSSGVIGMRVADNPLEPVESTLYLIHNPINHATHHKVMNLPFTMSNQYGGNLLKLHNRRLLLYLDRIIKLLIQTGYARFLKHLDQKELLNFEQNNSDMFMHRIIKDYIDLLKWFMLLNLYYLHKFQFPFQEHLVKWLNLHVMQ